MKIVRYLNQLNQIEFGASDEVGNVFKLHGDIFDHPEVTSEPSIIAKLLAPVQPTSILGIGLNYRRHAEESNAKVPERNSFLNRGQLFSFVSFVPSLMTATSGLYESASRKTGRSE